MTRDLENMTSMERLKELGLFSIKKKGREGTIGTVFQYINVCVYK